MSEDSKFNFKSSNILDLLIESGLVTSKNNAKKLLTSGGIYINNNGQEHHSKELLIQNLLFNKYVVLRKGKKTIKIGKKI